MTASVVGTIRADFLANVAQFNAACKSAARDGLGGFTEEVRRFNQRGSTQKVIASQIAAESQGWKSAMREVRRDREAILGKESGMGLLFGGLGRMNARSSTEYQTRSRLLGYLPWGMSARVELTKEAADTAAAIGAGTEKVGRSLRSSWYQLRGVGNAAIGRTYFGPLGSLGAGVMDMSMATKGVGLFAGGLLVAHRIAANLGREIQQVREEALQLGITYDELARRRGIPGMSRFTEGGALSATHGWEGTKTFGAYLWGGAVAAFAGAGSVRALSEDARKTDEDRLWLQRLLKQNAPIQAMQKEVHALRSGEEAAAFKKWVEDNSPTDRQIAAWKKWAAAVKEAIAETKVRGALSSMRDTILDLRYGEGSAARERFSEDLLASGRKGKAYWSGVERYDRTQEQISRWREYHTAQGAYGQAAVAEPYDRYEKSMADLNNWYRQGMLWEQQYNTLRMNYLKEYYQAAAGLNAEQMRKATLSPVGAYREQAAWIRDMVRMGAVNPQVADAFGGTQLKALRGQLGIQNPLRDFADAMKDLNELAALGPGALTADEYAKRRNSLRETALAALTKDQGSVSPIAAMLAGSQEAHRTITQNALDKQQTELLRRIKEDLDKIEVNTRPKGKALTLDEK